MIKVAGLSAVLATVATVVSAQDASIQEQGRIAVNLNNTCTPLIDQVVAGDLAVSDENLTQCVAAFQQSVGYYVGIFQHHNVGVAPGCNEALMVPTNQAEMTRTMANDIAQNGWRCLATYAQNANVAFFLLNLDTRMYEATTIVPYCIAAASGQVDGDALDLEFSGCVNGSRRLGLGTITP